MPVHRELILFDQTRKRLVLPADTVIVDEVEHFGLRHEEPAIDYLSVSCVLFTEAGHAWRSDDRLMAPKRPGC